MPKTIYLAGRITGDPNYKEKFAAAAQTLEAAGYIVVNPAILPEQGFTYAAYMRMARAMLAECEAICLLPDWQRSKGAKTEYRLAKKTGKEICRLHEDNRLGIAAVIRSYGKRLPSPLFRISHMIRGDFDIARADRLKKYGYIGNLEYRLTTRKARQRGVAGEAELLKCTKSTQAYVDDLQRRIDLQIKEAREYAIASLLPILRFLVAGVLGVLFGLLFVSAFL